MRFRAAVLAGLSLAMMSGCVRTFDARTVYSYPPNTIDCPVKYYEDMVFPPDGTRFEVLGVVNFQQQDGQPVAHKPLPEHEKEIAARVCLWGGDGFVLVSQAHGVAAVLPWSPNSTYGYAVLRELRSGEVSKTAQLLGITDEKLKQQVAFDEECEPGRIQVTSKQEDQGSGNYRVQACGKNLKYRRVGTVYSKVSADP
jgi:hypothetical protein